MTIEESRQLKAMALLDCQEAEERLALLIEKGLTTEDLLKDAALRLHISCKPEDCPFQDLAASDITGPRYREAVNLDRVIQLLQELKTQRQRVETLRQRKLALGMK